MEGRTRSRSRWEPKTDNCELTTRPFSNLLCEETSCLLQIRRRVDLHGAEAFQIHGTDCFPAFDQLDEGGLVPFVRAALLSEPPLEDREQTAHEGRSENCDADRLSRGPLGREVLSDVRDPAVGSQGD